MTVHDSIGEKENFAQYRGGASTSFEHDIGGGRAIQKPHYYSRAERDVHRR